MSVRVPVRPELLSWAAERARLSDDDLVRRFPRYPRWQAGDVWPTLRQLEDFARAAHAPLGYLLLDEPPHEELPVPDYRTVGNAGVSRPSPDLLDTIYICQARQEWYRDHAVAEGHEPLAFVGAARDRSVTAVAEAIRTSLGFGLSERVRLSSWEDARRRLIDAIEDLGVLVMISGIVGGNTHRRLDPQEFRGFTLADRLAPLVFVNGADTKAAQIFTLVHEVAHVWAGESAVSDAQMAADEDNERELWANRVAAEVLVPARSLDVEYHGSADVPELERLARLYRVSTLVVLKRIFDTGRLAWDDYRERYEDELTRVADLGARNAEAHSGGNYYATQPLRVSRHFARAVIADALEGRTLYSEAYTLLGMAKHETFVTMAADLGLA